MPPQAQRNPTRQAQDDPLSGLEKTNGVGRKTPYDSHQKTLDKKSRRLQRRRDDQAEKTVEDIDSLIYHGDYVSAAGLAQRTLKKWGSKAENIVFKNRIRRYLGVAGVRAYQEGGGRKYLEIAEDAYKESVEDYVEEGLGGKSDVARALNGLAVVEVERRNLGRAWEYLSGECTQEFIPQDKRQETRVVEVKGVNAIDLAPENSWIQTTHGYLMHHFKGRRNLAANAYEKACSGTAEKDGNYLAFNNLAVLRAETLMDEVSAGNADKAEKLIKNLGGILGKSMQLADKYASKKEKQLIQSNSEYLEEKRLQALEYIYGPEAVRAAVNG
ncbi:MAG: hypothetical protein GF334_11610 [Candidatus Altiarchaeales archaeon]|nr:hypothetical protein [Candidatus Altiarchaeales archaeon]